MALKSIATFVDIFIDTRIFIEIDIYISVWIATTRRTICVREINIGIIGIIGINITRMGSL